MQPFYENQYTIENRILLLRYQKLLKIKKLAKKYLAKNKHPNYTDSCSLEYETKFGNTKCDCGHEELFKAIRDFEND